MPPRKPLPPKQPARLTQQEMQAGINRLKKRLEEVKQFDPRSVSEQFNRPHVTKLEAAIDASLVDTFGGDSLDYKRYKGAAYFDHGPLTATSVGTPISEVHKALSRSKENSIALLEQAIESLEERLCDAAPVARPSDFPVTPKELSRKVFIVHGREEGPRETVARFLERLGFEPIILHEQASGGRTVIEKIEAHRDVGFAVVLLTPDDVGGSKGGASEPRARQNVILELGYFMGLLGRSHVCALKRGELEVPSDFEGVVYVPLDNSGGWKQALGKELEEAGFEIDWNKVMSS